MMCSKCRKRERVEGKSQCQHCRDVTAAYRASHKAERVAYRKAAKARDPEGTRAYFRQKSAAWRATHPGYTKGYYSRPDVVRRGRNRMLVQEYGLTVEQVDAMNAAQGGLCAICLKPPTGSIKSNQILHVDHDHKTGKVRQLLCADCNRILGVVNEDPAILQRMIDYLRTHKAEVHAA